MKGKALLDPDFEATLSEQSTILTSSANITCLCGAIAESGDLLAADKFPISCGLCCCEACRYTSGPLGGNGAALKTAPSNASLNACTSYQSNEGFTRYFCTTCGCKMFWYGKCSGMEEQEEWEVMVGAIDRTDDRKDIDTIQIRRCTYVSSLKDGGLPRIMSTTPQTSDIKFFAGGDNSAATPLGAHEASQLWDEAAFLSSQSRRPINVPLSCHCGAVRLQIESPEHSQTTSDPKHIERWTRNSCTKYVAKICVCRSDRKNFGTPMTVWTYVFPENILSSTGAHIDFSFERAETIGLPDMKVYRSSEDVRRSFCGKCGASVFYEHRNRPWIVNVMPGLLRSEKGSLAEDLLSWDWKWVSWPEENQNKEYLDSLTGGELVMR